MPFAVKFGCAAAVASIAGLFGFLESYRLKARVKQLEQYLSFLHALLSEIEFAALPIRQIVEMHRGEAPFLNLCGDSLERGCSFQESWRHAVIRADGGLQKQDLTYLFQFGEDFGKTDKTGQLLNCRLTIQRLEEQLAKAKEDVAKKAKLCCSLGILCGAGVFCIIV